MCLGSVPSIPTNKVTTSFLLLCSFYDDLGCGFLDSRLPWRSSVVADGGCGRGGGKGALPKDHSIQIQSTLFCFIDLWFENSSTFSRLKNFLTISQNLLKNNFLDIISKTMYFTVRHFCSIPQSLFRIEIDLAKIFPGHLDISFINECKVFSVFFTPEFFVLEYNATSLILVGMDDQSINWLLHYLLHRADETQQGRNSCLRL